MVLGRWLCMVVLVVKLIGLMGLGGSWFDVSVWVCSVGVSV